MISHSFNLDLRETRKNMYCTLTQFYRKIVVKRTLYVQQLVKRKTTQTGSFFNQSWIKLEHSARKEFKNKDQSRSSDGNIRKTIALFIIYEKCIGLHSFNQLLILFIILILPC